jgi:hypothetical protein
MDCPELALSWTNSSSDPLVSRYGVAPRTSAGISGRRDAQMGSNAKKQTTMAKLNRERRLKERRELKAEKKEARKQLALEEAAVEVEPADALPGD